MLVKKLLLFFIIILAICNPAMAQYADHDVSVSISYNYITSSKLYFFPNSTDPILRENHDELNGINSYSAEVKYRINQPFVIGISFEYLEKTHKTNLTLAGPSGSTNVRMEEGYSVIPIEITGYYVLPFSTEKFKFYMGLGGGFYFGNHIRKIDAVELKNVSRPLAYGIHVNVGMNYMIDDYISVQTEMRFRDPQFEVESKYNNVIVELNDKFYGLPENNLPAKVNINGLMFSLGISIHIF
ncbi:MAG: outer membrane beta-barrel protein [Bacteroidetes bacterium]|nr:outer membrane beta-barrel protein [Bacteroidota bacterium]